MECHVKLTYGSFGVGVSYLHCLVQVDPNLVHQKLIKKKGNIMGINLATLGWDHQHLTIETTSSLLGPKVLAAGP